MSLLITDWDPVSKPIQPRVNQISHLPIRSWTISQNYLLGAILDFHTPLPKQFGFFGKNGPPIKTLGFYRLPYTYQHTGSLFSKMPIVDNFGTPCKPDWQKCITNISEMDQPLAY
jgi:hypothetical protein